MTVTVAERVSAAAWHPFVVTSKRATNRPGRVYAWLSVNDPLPGPSPAFGEARQETARLDPMAVPSP